MKKIDTFSIQKHKGPYENWPRRSRLFFNGLDTKTKIPGYIIEGQYACDDGYLLITSQDSPFEESNDFILLDTSFKLIAQEVLLVPYDTYLLHAHWPISDTAVRLHYYEKLFFTLSIQKAGSFGRKRKLLLQPFENPENDPTAAASMADLEQLLKKNDKGSSKNDKQSG